jgi:hypothetical protein
MSVEGGSLATTVERQIGPDAHLHGSNLTLAHDFSSCS